MKLKILKEKLERGLNLAEKIPTKKLSLPILENVLLETKENYFKVVTTNLESALLWWSLAKIEKEGKICVPKKLFSDTIAKIQANILDLSQKENFFLIETETLNVKLKTYDPSEFPIIPQPSENLVCEIPAENLILGIKKVYNFVAQSLSRPEIAGILISFQGDTIKFVATDSFRLGEKKLPLGKEIPNPVSFILPQSAAKEIVNIFSSREKNLKIYFSLNQIFIESIMEETDHPEILYTARLIEGEYPEYQEIVPKKFETEIDVYKNEFLQKIKTASLFASKANEIKLKISPKENKIFIFAQNTDFGEIEASMEAQIKGKAMEISFNYKFLEEGIESCDGEKIQIKFTSLEGPAMISSLQDENYFYLLMPIKTS